MSGDLPQSQNEGNSTMPYDSLEMSYKTIQPAWGVEASPELREKLNEIKSEAYPDENGNLVVDVASLWGLLSYFSRDLRLGNLSTAEFKYCKHWLDIAGMCLQENFVTGFLQALKFVISTLELSQSKKGFLRKLLQSFTTISQTTNTSYNDPSKRSLTGGMRKNE